MLASYLLSLLALLSLAGCLALLLTCACGVRKLPSLAQVGAAGDDFLTLPPLSVIVAARNEEREIEATLQSLLNSDYPDLEVILVNDRSQDSTGEIGDRLSQEDRRLRVLHLRELPAGWFGKCYANSRAAAEARGEVLLFTDADVAFDPAALARSVRYLSREKLAHLAALPATPSPTTWLGVCLLTYSLLVLLGQPWRVSDPKSSRYLGVGPFNLFRAAAYREMEGHRRVKLCPNEDLMMGKLAKLAGYRSGALRAGPMVTFRWYSSLREMVQGLEKNFFASLDYRLSLAALVTLLLLGGLTAPIALAAPAWLLPGPGLGAGLAFAAAAGLSWLAGIIVARERSFPWWYALLLPAGAVLVVLAMWRSALITIRRGVTWGGPPTPLSVLKANRLRKEDFPSR